MSQKFADDLQAILNEINENTILCKSVFCSNYEDFIGSIVVLDEEIEYLRDNELPYDPNQLSLELGIRNLPKPNLKKTLKFGNCRICGVTHALCPNCDEIIVIDDLEEFYCESCETSFIQTFIGDRQIYRMFELE